MDNLPNWAQALLCVYLLMFGLIAVLFNTIEFMEDYGEIGLILGCVLWAREEVEEYLNPAGVFIVTIFMVIITLPAIVIATFVCVVFRIVKLFWKCFKKLFAKRTIYNRKKLDTTGD